MGGINSQIPLMVKPPQVENPVDAYSNVLKLQGAIQSRDLNRERIKQEQLENQQKQRSIDAQNAFTQALQENMTIGEDGNPKVNYVGAIKRVTELGHGEQAINLGKMRKEDYTDAANQITAQLNQTEKKAKAVGDLAGTSFRVQNWQDPNEIARARNESIAAIDQGEKNGVIDPQTAATYRAQAANYNQDFQSHLDAMASQGETLGRRYRAAGEAVKNLHDLTLGGYQEREGAAKATGEELGLAAQTAGPVSSSGQTPGASPGLITPGNIDLKNRPVVKNPDGTTSTVKTITIEEDGKTILIPTIVGGKAVSEDEAIQHYHQTGEHMGIFKSEQDADNYDRDLHNKMGWNGPAGSAQAQWQAGTPEDDETQYQNYVAQQTPAAQRVIRAREPKYSEGVYDRINRLGVPVDKRPEYDIQTRTAAAMNKMKPEDWQAQVDSVAAPKGDTAALNSRTRALVNSAVLRGDWKAAQAAIKDASDQLGREEVAKKNTQSRIAIEMGSLLDSGSDGKPSSTAQLLANYQLNPTSVLSRIPAAARESLMAQVKSINPDFHQEYYNNFNKTESDATTGKIGISANALNTMMGHLSVLNTAADALKNGDLQIMNRVANFVGVQTGKSPVTTYNTIVHRLGPEVTKAYLASGGTVGERGTNQEDFDAKLGPDQIKQNVGVSALLADSKIKALQDQYKRGTYGLGKQKLITDEAETARQRLTTQAPANLSGGGVKVTDPKGTVHTFKSQADADSFKAAAGIQ